MKPVRRAGADFRWEDVELLAYKPEGEKFLDVTRQRLFGPEAGAGCELRYFEGLWDKDRPISGRYRDEHGAIFDPIFFSPGQVPARLALSGSSFCLAVLCLVVLTTLLICRITAVPSAGVS